VNTWMRDLEAMASQKPWKPSSTDFNKKNQFEKRSVKIKSALRTGAKSRDEICEVTGINATTLHKDLAQMEDAGLIEGHKRGRVIYWGIVK